MIILVVFIIILCYNLLNKNFITAQIRELNQKCAVTAFRMLGNKGGIGRSARKWAQPLWSKLRTRPVNY